MPESVPPQAAWSQFLAELRATHAVLNDQPLAAYARAVTAVVRLLGNHTIVGERDLTPVSTLGLLARDLATLHHPSRGVPQAFRGRSSENRPPAESGRAILIGLAARLLDELLLAGEAKNRPEAASMVVKILSCRPDGRAADVTAGMVDDWSTRIRNGDPRMTKEMIEAYCDPALEAERPSDRCEMLRTRLQHDVFIGGPNPRSSAP